MSHVASENAAPTQFASLSLNSGFDFDFVEPLDSKHECAICLLVLRNPMQTTCGHRFCRDCIINCINGCNKECPIDKQPLSENGLFHDSCVEREILQLKVICPNSSLGCKNHVDLKYIEDHIRTCIYQPVLCPNECSITVLQNELDEHLTYHCLHRMTQCAHCQKTFPYNYEQLHLADCPQVSVPCELCGTSMPRGTVPEHRNESCPRTEVPCSFVEHGCQYKATRINMKNHMEKSVDIHIQLLSTSYKKINTLVLDLYRNIGLVVSGTFSRQPSLRSQISSSSLNENFASPSQSERTLESSLLGAVGGLNLNLNNPLCLNELVGEKQEWDIENEVKRLQQSVIDFDPVKKEQSEDKNELKNSKSCPETSSTVHGKILRDLSNKSLDIDQRVLQEMIKIDNLSKKIDFVECSLKNVLNNFNEKFCNGILIWKIPNFTQVCNVMEQKSKIYHSSPFYTSPYGYKFCLRTNLTLSNGERYLTLYIHMMQSENDDFLSWPFKGSISLSVLDCREGDKKLHFVENMQISSPMEAFRMPKTFRSIKGYGFKEYISLDQIIEPSHGCCYLNNDVLYIKAVVIPK